MEDVVGAYELARKMAKRAYNRKVSLGRSGNLPYLDDLLLNVEIVSKETLGIIELPIKKVIGTYSSGRSTSFAYNFMPLLGLETEFAAKWRSLYEIQMTEGIRDPVKVYEYLNRFYVVEGNKRVSVLKFIDAPAILADVTRLIPKYDESDENIKLYYEFLDFYKEFKINSIWVKKPGGFKSLAAMINRIYVPEADRANRSKYFLDNYYMPFRRMLYEIHGDRMGLSTGDVFVRYFTLYHIPSVITEAKIKPKLEKFCEELMSSVGYEDVDLQIKPEEPPEPSLFTAFINIVKPKQKLKIAFAYAETKEVSNWVKAHENGRQHIDGALSSDISTTFVDNVPEDLDAYFTFKDLIQKGNSVIFATSPAFSKGALKAALEFPHVRIYVCSELQPSRHVHTYFGRMYEPRFLTGLIAGALTKTDIIGYVGSYPVKGVISGVNAFALGARLVNPNARILVSWACQWESPKPDGRSGKLLDAGADIISHQNTFTGVGFEGEYGLYSMECGDESCGVEQYIATPVWNWGIFYEKMVRNIILSGINNDDHKPMQFWWGLDSGIVDIMYAKKYVPNETHRLIQLFKGMMRDGTYNPFSGPIYDVAGTLRIEGGESATVQEIIGMDWFVHGIEGDLPDVIGADIDVTSDLLEL